jgi:plasmid stabilization system protein ParE
LKIAVNIMASAWADIEQACDAMASVMGPEKAEAWVDGLLAHLLTLENMPWRCPLAPESIEFDGEIRHLLHGKGRNCHRVLFTISDGPRPRTKVVDVVHIRHASRDVLRAR